MQEPYHRTHSTQAWEVLLQTSPCRLSGKAPSMHLRRSMGNQLQQQHRQQAPTPLRTPRGRSGAAVVVRCQQQQVNKGFSVLEWTSKLVPQGALVTGACCCWLQNIHSSSISNADCRPCTAEWVAWTLLSVAASSCQCAASCVAIQLSTCSNTRSAGTKRTA